MLGHVNFLITMFNGDILEFFEQILASCDNDWCDFKIILQLVANFFLFSGQIEPVPSNGAECFTTLSHIYAVDRSADISV